LLRERKVKVSDFDFELPERLIASHPLSQRDASRMLVAGSSPARGELRGGSCLEDKCVSDLISYLRPGDAVVFNNSKVIPARFNAFSESGAKYEITLHTNHALHDCPSSPQEGETSGGAWYGFAKKFQKLQVGELLKLEDGTPIRIVDKNDESGLLIKFLCDDVFAVLNKVGKMPLPPYMNRDENLSDRERYQTVYADPVGSMAAPTAGLHFTPELLEKIRSAGAEIVNITLHVGAGTWLPIRSEDTDDHKMHGEWGQITPEQADKINSAKRVIAIGTTSLRLLESAAVEHLSFGSDSLKCRIKPFCGTTDIFITPGYEFKIVDALLTNFHLPKSTLFMLVSAFAGLPEMKEVYAHAIAKKYRFFSYGDCCLLFKSKK
jgi:S-adenosylmethionine:tRNA ribosyltransferase-isomerase